MIGDRRINTAPSILAVDFAKLGVECEAIEQQGCDWARLISSCGGAVATALMTRAS
jgi:hypothetical protein